MKLRRAFESIFWGAATLFLCFLPATFGQRLPAASDQGAAELRERQRQEEEDLARNTPPLRVGLWEVITIDADGHRGMPVQNIFCELRDAGLFFGIKVTKAAGGIGGAGIRWHFTRVADSEFLETLQLLTTKHGLATAKHHIVLHGPMAFKDSTETTEGKRMPTLSTSEGHWVRECPK